MLRKLEKYEVLDEIGHGGMATVYRARDSSLDRFVALKVLHPHLQRTTEARARFTREAKSVARLRHPGIAAVHTIDEDRGVRYIAMEWIPGQSLDERLDAARRNTTRLPTSAVLQWGAEIASALDYSHANGVLHRANCDVLTVRIKD